eukprot:8555291-Pyramimonas_sp.AAC.1
MEDRSSGRGAHLDSGTTPGRPQEPDSGRCGTEGGGSAAIPTIHTEVRPSVATLEGQVDSDVARRE